uniref:Uncharacterized protein n=1 Tax=Rhizophora mucronata TaxID=61149 RepID=A0A2P2P8R9_RHIMU
MFSFLFGNTHINTCSHKDLEQKYWPTFLN